MVILEIMEIMFICGDVYLWRSQEKKLTDVC